MKLPGRKKPTTDEQQGQGDDHAGHPLQDPHPSPLRSSTRSEKSDARPGSPQRVSSAGWRARDSTSSSSAPAAAACAPRAWPAQRGAARRRRRGRRARRHLRQPRLHPEEALQLRRPLCRRASRRRAASAGRVARAALRLERAEGQPGARDRAPQRRLRRAARRAPASRMLRGRARLRRRRTRSRSTASSTRAERILVATGGWPVSAGGAGRRAARSARTRSSTCRRFPKRLVVVGGGYIACEFASIFNGLGAQVTQLYRGEQILRGFDDDVRDFVAAEMRKKGVDIRVDAAGAGARDDARRRDLRVALDDGSRARGRRRALRHRARAEHRRPRPRGARRRARAERRGRRRRGTTAATCPASTRSATSSTGSS